MKHCPITVALPAFTFFYTKGYFLESFESLSDFFWIKKEQDQIHMLQDREQNDQSVFKSNQTKYSN